jgi:hypothetical protein
MERIQRASLLFLIDYTYKVRSGVDVKRLHIKEDAVEKRLLGHVTLSCITRFPCNKNIIECTSHAPSQVSKWQVQPIRNTASVFPHDMEKKAK